MERIEGINPVLEALRAGRKCSKILVAHGLEKSASLRQILALARERRVPVHAVSRSVLDRSALTKYQGIVAMCMELVYQELDDVLAKIKGPPFLVILDGIEDPRNLGAILRSADGVGAHAVIIPEKHSTGLTAAVAKASAGAVEYVPVVKVTNIAAEIPRLKKIGIRVAGADADAKLSLFDAELRGPIAFVVGGESQGIRRLVKERCDFLVRIPMLGRISCLNASVVAALLMYEKLRQERRGAKKEAA